jgi:glycogen debranching enzyme
VKENFQPTFWRPDWGYLVDYVGNGPQDQAVRPNILIPLYLEYSPVDDEVVSEVVMTINDELLTKRGLRSLSPRNEAYRGVYEGSQIDRDLAYHQGCAFPELLAPYIDLCFRMMGSTFYGRAKYLVEGFYDDISKHGVGCFSELYDGDPPHEPHGAIASAMSTAALLHIEHVMNQYKKEDR